MRKIVSKQVIAVVMEVVVFVVFIICFRTICINLQDAGRDYNLIEALLRTRTTLIAAIISGMVLIILSEVRKIERNQPTQAMGH